MPSLESGSTELCPYPQPLAKSNICEMQMVRRIRGEDSTEELAKSSQPTISAFQKTTGIRRAKCLSPNADRNKSNPAKNFPIWASSEFLRFLSLLFPRPSRVIIFCWRIVEVRVEFMNLQFRVLTKADRQAPRSEARSCWVSPSRSRLLLIMLSGRTKTSAVKFVMNEEMSTKKSLKFRLFGLSKVIPYDCRFRNGPAMSNRTKTSTIKWGLRRERHTVQVSTKRKNEKHNTHRGLPLGVFLQQSHLKKLKSMAQTGGKRSFNLTSHSFDHPQCNYFHSGLHWFHLLTTEFRADSTSRTEDPQTCSKHSYATSTAWYKHRWNDSSCAI